MSWLRRRKPRVDPEQLTKNADAVIDRVDSQQPHVTALTTWLERRKSQNGFGDDFEYSLRPKGTR